MTDGLTKAREKLAKAIAEPIAEAANEASRAAYERGRQEGFAEAREMAAVLSQSWRNGGYHIRDLPRHIRTLQPPRDEGKREGGDE